MIHKFGIQFQPSVRIYISFVVLSFLLLSGRRVAAQVSRGEDGEIEDLVIVIDKNRKIELPEIQRDPVRIPLPINQVIIQKPKYSYIEYNVKLPEAQPKVKVLTLKPEIDKPFGKGFLRAGVGNLTSFLVEGSYQAQLKKNFIWGVEGKHFSSGQGPSSPVTSGWASNNFGLYSRYFTESLIVDAKLNYRRDFYNFYGLPAEAVRGKDSTTQFFDEVRFVGNIRNKNAESPFQWNANFEVGNLNDAFKAKEFEINTKFGGTYKIDSVSGINLPVNLLLTKRADSTEQDRNLFSIRPTYYYKLGDLKLSGGLNVVYDSDTFSNVSRTQVFPILRADFEVLPGELSVYAGLDGDVEQRTLRSVTRENPWLGRNILLGHTYKLLDVYAGGNFSLTKNLQLGASVSFQRLRNVGLFFNQVVDSSLFEIRYDRGTSDLTTFKLDLQYKINENFRLMGDFQYWNYKLSENPVAWHLPTLKAGGAIYAGITPKLNTYLRADFFGVRKAKAVASDSEIELAPQVNLNIGADYAINNKWGVFLTLDNLLNQQNPIYLYYPTRGLLGMVGASYRF